MVEEIHKGEELHFTWRGALLGLCAYLVVAFILMLVFV